MREIDICGSYTIEVTRRGKRKTPTKRRLKTWGDEKDQHQKTPSTQNYRLHGPEAKITNGKAGPTPERAFNFVKHT